MKILTLLFIISLATIYSQEVKLTIDKYEYQFDEIIEITYEVDSLIDSIVVPDYDNFKVVSGPFKSITSSVINGVKSSSSKISFKLRPLKSGELTIESPIFIVDEKNIKAKSVIVNIAPSNLTEDELKDKEYKQFINDSSKPKGTTRIIIHENKGYIEIYNGKDWEFQRRLSTEEIEQIGRIK